VGTLNGCRRGPISAESTLPDVLGSLFVVLLLYIRAYRVFNMVPPRPATHVAKRARVGERTMLACIGCKQRKLKASHKADMCPTIPTDIVPVRWSNPKMPELHQDWKR
jgi:hypothetical protein